MTYAEQVTEWWDSVIPPFDEENTRIKIDFRQIAYAGYLATITTQSMAEKFGFAITDDNTVSIARYTEVPWFPQLRFFMERCNAARIMRAIVEIWRNR